MARSRRRPFHAASPSLATAARFLLAALVAGLGAGCASTHAVNGPGGPAWKNAGPPPEPESNEWRSVKSLRIGLAVGIPNASVSASTDWSLSVHGQSLGDYHAGVAVQIARTTGAIQATLQGNPSPIWTGGPGDTLVMTISGRGGYARWETKWYRGTFRVFASQESGLTLANDVDLESYLRSVLPNEIGTPPETDFEAVKAQAVAARSYTLSYLGRRAALGFDLYATVEDQVYQGVGRENAQSDRALDATRGQVLMNGGKPIRALYSSACGGRTANVEDVWPWPYTSYLRSVLDADGPDAKPYCSISANFRWREEWDLPTFMASLRQYGPAEGYSLGGLKGDLLDVRVQTRSRSGRVQELAITTTEGDWILRGDRIRWVLRRPGQSAILRSSFFKIGMIRDSKGRPVKVVASGAGNGHGIGLCQWGAMGMARSGKGYREILSHYYQDTHLETL